MANDQITESDPKFPKRLFPSQTQCPNCYLPSVKNIDELSDHESPWNNKECLLFLSSYYSRYQIVSIEQADVKVDNKKPTNEERRQVDEPHLPPEPIVDAGKENERVNVHAADRRIGLGSQINPNLGLEPIDNEKSSSSISNFSLIFVLSAFAIFGIVYIYFTYLRSAGVKAKKHII